MAESFAYKLVALKASNIGQTCHHHRDRASQRPCPSSFGLQSLSDCASEDHQRFPSRLPMTDELKVTDLAGAVHIQCLLFCFVPHNV